MRRCPRCNSTNVVTERRINGNSQCKVCNYKEKTEKFDNNELEEGNRVRTADLFLFEGINEVPDIQTDTPTPQKPTTPQPQTPEPETQVEPDVADEVIEDPLTKDIVKYQNIDLNIVNSKTSKFFSFDALRDTLKSINSLIDIQDKMVLKDIKETNTLRDIKDRTTRLKLIILKYIANFKSYEQEEIDKIRPIFVKIAVGLAKETKLMAKNIN